MKRGAASVKSLTMRMESFVRMTDVDVLLSIFLSGAHSIGSLSTRGRLDC